MESVRIGNVEVLPIQDSVMLADPNRLFPQHGETMLREYAHLLDERKLMQMSVTCFLVRSAGKTMLIDSGLGAKKRPGLPGGKLDQALEKLDLRPEDFDLIVHTHLHVDHVGWNTVAGDDGKPRVFFPYAKFVVQQTEWDFWMQPEKVFAPGNEHLAECVEPLRDSGRLDFRDGEVALDENITFISTPGHTPGHVSIGVASAGERAIIVGDASHHPAQIDHPDWSPTFDVDPVQGAKTRAKLFDEAEADGRKWLAGHWEFPGMGQIVRLDGKRVFKAL